MNDIPETTSPEAGTRPVISILPGRQKRVRAGHPWVFSNEIKMTPEEKALTPGTVIDMVDAAGSAVGSAIFNPGAKALAPGTAVISITSPDGSVRDVVITVS